MSVVDVVDLLIVKFNLATESHPLELVVLYVYTPLDVYEFPFQLYLLQAVRSVVEVVGRLIVKFKLATESHPLELEVLYVYTPLDVYEFPFQLY